MLVPFLHWISHKNDFVLCLLQKGLQGMGGAFENAVLSLEIGAGACWALENAAPSFEIVVRACSEPHVHSKSQLRPAPEPTCLGPWAADIIACTLPVEPHP